MAPQNEAEESDDESRKTAGWHEGCSENRRQTANWGRQDFFDFFFKSCGGQKKGKILKKVAVGAPAKVCLGQNLDFVRRSVIPKSLKIEYMKGKFCKTGLY